MATNAAKPWTGTGCDNAWTVGSSGGNPFEQAINANYGLGNPCGLTFKNGTTNLSDSMITTTLGIDARGDSGTLTFYLEADNLSGNAGWNMQLNPGTGFTTRLSELSGSNHPFQPYTYTLQPGDLVSNLVLRFQFSGGSNSNRIQLDQIAVNVGAGTTNGTNSAVSFSAKYVRIPGGSFIMGDHFNFYDPDHPSDEIPLHPVSISPLYMSTTLVTMTEYCAFLNSALSQGIIEVRSNVVYAVGGTNIYFYTHGANAYSFIQYANSSFSVMNNRDLRPVTSVRWFGAIAYCNWLSQSNGFDACYTLGTGDVDFTRNGFRLPTEAEWEYCAHGGLTNPYCMFPWGTNSNADGTWANWEGSGDPFESSSDYPNTTPVGFYNGSLRLKSDYNWPGSQSSYQTSDGSNPFGLYDMASSSTAMLASPIATRPGPSGLRLTAIPTRVGSRSASASCARRNSRKPWASSSTPRMPAPATPSCLPCRAPTPTCSTMPASTFTSGPVNTTRAAPTISITTSGGFMLPDYLIEVQPTRPFGGNIVWEWHAWDHMIQDYDNTKNNYGVVSSHPELVNCNGTGMRIQQFWNHMNSIDYNAQLDQIALSVRGNSELWIIDHQTTTAQAAGHSGGRYNKGGDILYRWGNPAQYKLGTGANQMLWQQHDVQWIPTNCPGAGHLLIHNNGIGRGYSSIDEIAPPVDGDGNYSRSPGSAFGPAALYWTYQATPPTNYYSSEISGAQRLPNGNTLVCGGIFGTLFEVRTNGQTAWYYINPETTAPLAQGTPVPPDPHMAGQHLNEVFKVHRYVPSYPGLANKDLTPRATVETYPGAATDTTGLGVPDLWVRSHFGTLSALTTNSSHSGNGLTDIQEYEFGLDPTAWSSTTNGIPDGWAIEYGFDPTTAAFGSSITSNGNSVLECYLADLNPTNAASRLVIAGLQRIGDDVHLSWTGGNNAWQYIECAPSLISNQWTTLFTNAPPTAVTNSLIHPGAATAGHLFYRVRAGR